MWEFVPGTCRVIDRCAVNVMVRLWLTGGDPNDQAVRERHEAAHESYTTLAQLASPGTCYRAPRAAQLEVEAERPIPAGRVVRHRWWSGYSPWDEHYAHELAAQMENASVASESFIHDPPRRRPAVICLHPWAVSAFQILRRLFLARELFEAGLDVIMMELPFHGSRCPRDAWFSGQLFPGTDPHRTNEGFGQIVWDVRALMEHLLANGQSHVGVLGISLGGYVAALLASIEPRLAFAASVLPLVSYADFLWTHGRGGAVQRAAEARGITRGWLEDLFAIHSPLRWPPVLPPDRLMIVGGSSDRICTPESVETLASHWGHPRTHWLLGGHVAQIGWGRAFRELIDFMFESTARPSAGPWRSAEDDAGRFDRRQATRCRPSAALASSFLCRWMSPSSITR